MAEATQQARAISRVYETARTWRAALPFILTTQPDKTDGVLTAWMDGCGGKEGKKDGGRKGWHGLRGGGEGEGERCVNWQRTARWKV